MIKIHVQISSYLVYFLYDFEMGYQFLIPNNYVVECFMLLHPVGEVKYHINFKLCSGRCFGDLANIFDKPYLSSIIY